MLSQILTRANFNLDFVSFSRLQKFFKPEQVLRGRMIQRLQNNLFVFRTKGLSLIAETTFPLQIGDVVTVKVQKKLSRIELKLLEVNGKPIKEKRNIPLRNFHYAKLPVPKEFLGREGFLEIYEYEKDENESHETGHGVLSFQLLLETGDSEFIVLNAYRLRNRKEFRIFSTDPDFSGIMNRHLSLLSDWLSESDSESVSVQILHRRRWDLLRPATENTSEKIVNLKV